VPRLSPIASDVDVAIVGAGAAGIAAARRCLASGLSCAVVEARPHVGGRCVTVAIDGHPVDLGAHWLHAGEMNPLVALGRERGEPLNEAKFASLLIMDGRKADDATIRDHRRAFEAGGEAVVAAAESADDVSIAEALPDLGRWDGAVRSTLALISGRPLEEASAKDFPSEEFGDNWLVRGGYGAYLSRLAEGLPVALGRAVERIDWSGEGVVIEGGWGRLTARAALVTVPIAVLASGAIRFTPDLPAPTRGAIEAFLPGTYEHIVLDWPDSPFEGADRFVKIVDGNICWGLASHIGGSPLHYMEIDHALAERHGRDRKALAAYAREWLVAQLGRDAVRNLTVPHVTDWFSDPLSREAWAVAKPGHVADRRTMREPIGERIWFAGEANSPRMWGTVGGAWEEAERAVSEIAARRFAKA
jgi:monoamine oxidase